MPWLTWLASLIERLVASWFGSRERERAARIEAASQQREADIREAERQEEIAEQARRVAQDAIAPDSHDYRD